MFLLMWGNFAARKAAGSPSDLPCQLPGYSQSWKGVVLTRAGAPSQNGDRHFLACFSVWAEFSWNELKTCRHEP